MGQATHKLVKTIHGITHYAEVTVTVTFEGNGTSISVSPAVFAWLKDVYGPDAWEWATCDAYRDGAVSGAVFALGHVSGEYRQMDTSVIIDRIHALLVDTTPSAVRYATCMAVWKALGVEGTELPDLIAKHDPTWTRS